MVTNRFRYEIIVPGLLLGGCPQCRDHVRRLREESGVSVVISLQTDADRQLYRLDWQELKAAYAQEGIELLEMPILDRDETDLARHCREAAALLEQVIQPGKWVLLHCNIGNGRSPTVVAAWLHWYRGYSLDEAVAHVQRCRPSQPNPAIIRRAESEVA